MKVNKKSSREEIVLQNCQTSCSILRCWAQADYGWFHVMCTRGGNSTISEFTKKNYHTCSHICLAQVQNFSLLVCRWNMFVYSLRLSCYISIIK